MTRWELERTKKAHERAVMVHRMRERGMSWAEIGKHLGSRCSVCRGDGQRDSATCDRCRGEGKVPISRQRAHELGRLGATLARVRAARGVI